MTTFVDQTTLVSATFMNAVAAIIEALPITALAAVTPATDKVPYFTGSSSAGVADLSSFGRTLIAVADAAAARAALGVESSTSDDEIDAIAALTSAADTVPYFDGPGSAALASFVAFGRTLVACVDAAAARTALGVQPTASPTFTGTATLPTTALGNHAVSGAKTFSFNSVVDEGNSGASKTIDFGTSQYKKLTMTASCTFTFTAPPGPCVVILDIYQNGTGGYAMTLPASVKWDEAYAAGDKLLTTTAGARNKLVLHYDGTDYVADLKKNIA